VRDLAFLDAGRVLGRGQITPCATDGPPGYGSDKLCDCQQFGWRSKVRVADRNSPRRRENRSPLRDPWPRHGAPRPGPGAPIVPANAPTPSNDRACILPDGGPSPQVDLPARHRRTL